VKKKKKSRGRSVSRFSLQGGKKKKRKKKSPPAQKKKGPLLTKGKRRRKWESAPLKKGKKRGKRVFEGGNVGSLILVPVAGKKKKKIVSMRKGEKGTKGRLRGGAVFFARKKKFFKGGGSSSRLLLKKKGGKEILGRKKGAVGRLPPFKKERSPTGGEEDPRPGTLGDDPLGKKKRENRIIASAKSKKKNGIRNS